MGGLRRTDAVLIRERPALHGSGSQDQTLAARAAARWKCRSRPLGVTASSVPLFGHRGGMTARGGSELLVLTAPLTLGGGTASGPYLPRENTEPRLRTGAKPLAGLPTAERAASTRLVERSIS